MRSQVGDFFPNRSGQYQREDVTQSTLEYVDALLAA
jgi:hypothetical protein